MDEKNETATVEDRELLRQVGIQEGSVAHIYATNPYASIIRETLNSVIPGEDTSYDFKKGFYAALAVAELRGAAVLESFAASGWEYGWRSFFPSGEEYEWLACSSREEAEEQIAELQAEEDAQYCEEKGNLEGRLRYTLWRRRRAAAGPWERPMDEAGE